jgi:lipopolysaccharide/colanic/teichoic acid biosynthesis glycosyltransferase
MEKTGHRKGGGKDDTARMRIFDLLAATALLMLFLPTMAVVALMTMVCNGGGAFRRISRKSQNGRTVTVLNFQCENVRRNETPFNRLLVDTGLVALPEFFNVLTGDLSFFDPEAAHPSIFSPDPANAG